MPFLAPLTITYPLFKPSYMLSPHTYLLPFPHARPDCFSLIEVLSLSRPTSHLIFHFHKIILHPPMAHDFSLWILSASYLFLSYYICCDTCPHTAYPVQVEQWVHVAICLVELKDHPQENKWLRSACKSVSSRALRWWDRGVLWVGSAYTWAGVGVWCTSWKNHLQNSS